MSDIVSTSELGISYYEQFHSIRWVPIAFCICEHGPLAFEEHGASIFAVHPPLLAWVAPSLSGKGSLSRCAFVSFRPLHTPRSLMLGPSPPVQLQQRGARVRVAQGGAAQRRVQGGHILLHGRQQRRHDRAVRGLPGGALAGSLGLRVGNPIMLLSGACVCVCVFSPHASCGTQ